MKDVRKTGLNCSPENDFANNKSKNNVDLKLDLHY